MSETIIDVEEFLERVQDDKELLVELLDIYSGDYQTKRKQLTKAVKEKDFDEVKSISHSLKGASGNISAKKMREIFMVIEDKSRNNDLSGVDNLLISLDKEFELLSGKIKELKEKFSK